MKRNTKKGFTIVELVIVIGVIAILSAILIPTFASLTKNAQDAALKSDLQNSYTMYLAKAVESDTDDLVDYAQDKVVLLEGKTGTQKGYAYTANGGWSIEAHDYTVGNASGQYTVIGTEAFGRFYVAHQNA